MVLGHESLLALQHPIVVKDLTVVLDTMLVQDSLVTADTVAVQDTIVANTTLDIQAVLAAEDTLVAQDTAAVQDTLAAPEPGPVPDDLISSLLHEPPAKGILNDRPYKVHLFVNLDLDQVLAVSLALKNDLSQVYREYSMTVEHGRFAYRLTVEDLVGSQLEYYFLVELRDYGLLAYPQTATSAYVPFVIPLVPPTREYFQRP